MAKRIIEFVQIDDSVYTDTLTRGLFCLSLSKQESFVVLDLRSSKSNELWTLYDKRNIKYVDDIINVISDINVEVFKTYFDLKSQTICCKNLDLILKHKNLYCFIEYLEQVYDNVCILVQKQQITMLEMLFSMINNIVLVSSNNPISFNSSQETSIQLTPKLTQNISLYQAIFLAYSNYSVDNENLNKTVMFSFDIKTQQEILNPKFLFNDDKNKFVIELNNFFNIISKENKHIFSDIYEQKHSYLVLKERLHKDLIKTLNKTHSDKQLKQDIKTFVEVLLKNYDINLVPTVKQKIVKELCDEIVGLGVLEDFVNDETITEIMVNGTKNVYVEKNGKLQQTNVSFESLEKLKIVIDRIASAVGRHIDDASPIVDARLKDGSRVNAIISPIAIDGHSLTIRKFSKHKLQAEDLISYNSISKEMVDFLKEAVKLKKNILISGGTGTGKTTLLNVISSFIGNDERIVTIEDSAELQLHQDHVVRLETRAKSIEGTSEITIRQLVVNSLRMRPDRIIVGECRSGETIDMLQAMNTGHSGSMTTVHSNSPQDAISRLLVMSLMSGIDLPEKAIISMIASAINIIVQIKRYEDGSRKIQEISMLKKSNTKIYEIVPLFVYNENTKSFDKVVTENI